MAIEFPDLEIWDEINGIVSFPADEEDRRISCAISREALQDNFGGDTISPLHAFRGNRHTIQNKAKQLILMGRFEPDGSILIRSSDFRF